MHGDHSTFSDLAGSLTAGGGSGGQGGPVYDSDSVPGGTGGSGDILGNNGFSNQGCNGGSGGDRIIIETESGGNGGNGWCGDEASHGVSGANGYGLIRW